MSKGYQLLRISDPEEDSGTLCDIEYELDGYDPRVVVNEHSPSSGCHDQNNGSPPLHSPSIHAALPRSIPIIPILICALCALITASIAAWPSLSLRVSSNSKDVLHITNENIHLLRRPSQYIRLDEIKRPAPPTPRSFSNFPILVQHIDGSQVNEVILPETHARLTHSGTIVPLERKVAVSRKISTIFQFRAIDWGMEQCEISFNIPPEWGGLKDSSTSVVSVYRLNATLPIQPSKLNYINRPPRLSKLDDIVIGDTSKWRRNVTCYSDSVLSFELACSSSDSDCNLSWWQGHDLTISSPVVFMTQYATI